MNKTDSSLNIIFIGESYLGGMAGSKRIQNIINSLLKLELITIHNLIIEKATGDSAEKKGIKNGVRYQRVPYSNSNPFQWISLYIKGFRFISKAKKSSKKNILYCYDSPTLLQLPLLLFARLKGFKVVIDFVEDYSLLNRSGLSRGKKVKLFIYRTLENNVRTYTNGILAISSYLEDQLKLKTRNKIPLLYLPITVNFDLFREQIKDNSSEKIRIFYGGSFGEKDGLLFLLKAFDELADHHNIELILTGKPPKSGMNTVLQQIEASAHKDHIHFLGYLDDNQYYATLQSCDIFCMTRINSQYANAGFPFKLGEMLATGNPVLATKVGDVPKFLENKKNAVLVEPDSVESIVEGLHFILTERDKSQQIGREGKKLAQACFNSDKIAISLREFLINLN